MRLALLCLLLAGLSWPALAQQDQSQSAPATTPPPSSRPPAQPSTPEGGQQAPGTEAPPSSAKTAKKKTSKRKKTKHSRKKHRKANSKKPAENADPGPRRIVVRRGGTSETGGQLEPGVPVSETDHQRQATEQILQSTDASLKNITRRKLTADQQDMVRQITLYMEQSRSANKEGDLGRARNLAVKAHQLSDALARQ